MATKMEAGEVDGFATVTLRNAAISVTVVPALGARLISLRSVHGAREWLWRPADRRGLFACAAGTAFEDGPLAGSDECVPTVMPCVVEGQAIPDHGEVWSREWRLDPNEKEAITTRIELRTRPLNFARRISLAGNELRLDYTLTNRASRATGYLWALHPLFTLEEGDAVELHGKAEVVVQGTQESALARGERGPWPVLQGRVRLDQAETGAVSSPDKPNSYLKAFLSTAQAPAVSLIDRRRGERLTLKVAPHEVVAWGYWVSRGGWFGHTHIALEATNATADGLDELMPGIPAHTLAPHEVRTWTVRIALATGQGESAKCAQAKAAGGEFGSASCPVGVPAYCNDTKRPIMLPPDVTRGHFQREQQEPNGEENPFKIRAQSESHHCASQAGAAVQGFAPGADGRALDPPAPGIHRFAESP